MSHWQVKTTIRYTDRLFTQYIKLRDKGVCQYKFRCFGEEGSDNSHFQGRRKESVRNDPENCDLACRKCHAFVHTSEGAKVLEEWKRNQLGDRRYKMLLVRANTTGKRDDFTTTLYIKELMKELKLN